MNISLTASMTTTTSLVSLLADAMPTRIQAVRTDYVVTPAGKNRRVLIVEAPGRRMPRIRLSDWESERDVALNELRNKFNLRDAEAITVITAAAQLAETNDLGAWLLRTPNEPERHLSGETFRPQGRLRNQRDLSDAYDALARALPTSWRVKLSYIAPPEGMPYVHRRAWAAFLDEAGNELASISLGFTSIQLRHHIDGNNDQADAAQRRLGRWAHQLGIGLREFIRAFLAIELLSRYTEATEIFIEG